MSVYLGKNKIGITKYENLDTELTEQETLLNKLEEDVNALSDKDDTTLRILDGTLEEFDNKKVKATKLEQYRFYQFKDLKSVDFTGITDIPKYTCGLCRNLENVTFDKNATTIADFAFTTNSNLKKIKGNFDNIGEHAFSQTSSVTEVDIKVNGSISHNAFSSATSVSSFNLSKDSVVTSLGNSCFSGLGVNRSNPENNKFKFDFSNSTFTSIGSSCFGNQYSPYMKYFDIIFPTTLTSLSSSNIFRNSSYFNLYFKRLTPCTLSSSALSLASNFKMFVPYNSVNAYKTATNWATYVDNIIGYADRDTFAQGQQLPQYSLEGYALTWYSDVDLTTQVTTAESPNNYYYCTISAEQVDVVSITSLYQDNCKIAVTNSLTGYEYTEYEGILVGTQLTITATPTIAGYVPYILTLNDVDFTSTYSYTTASGTNINLVGIYYNGVDIPINPDFNQNSWVIIKRVVQSGTAGQYWSVGDVKEIEIDGLTYGIRLSDLQLGRYNYANGTKTTNAVFEFVQLYNTNYRMNATNTNAGGWATAELQTTINSTILDKIPMELRSLLEEVVVVSANGGSSNYTAITTSNNKLFLPCAFEINLSSSYGRDGEGTTWDYYVGAGNSLRIKMKPNTTMGVIWWLRSPYPTNAYNFSYVGGGGSAANNTASSGYAVCPCFAW